MPLNVQVPAAELKPPSASSAPSVGARGTRQDLARVRATHRRLDALQLPRGRGACRRALSIDSNGMGLGHGMLSIADSLSAALSGNFTYVPSITSLSIWADDPNFCGAPVTKLDSHGCMLSLQSHTGDPPPLRACCWLCWSRLTLCLDAQGKRHRSCAIWTSRPAVSTNTQSSTPCPRTCAQ